MSPLRGPGRPSSASSPGAGGAKTQGESAAVDTGLEAAVQWQVRLSDGRPDDQAQADFHRWLAADPAHADAWARLEQGLAGTVRRLQAALRPQAGPLRLALLHPERARRRFLRRSLALAAVGVGSAWLLHRQIPLPGLVADLATGTGQRKAFVLPDGSAAVLDARSRVDLRFDGQERLVRLLAGAIHIRTAADPLRPFRVATAQGVVEALGTEFSVRQETEATLVGVERDRVRVQEWGGRQAELGAGESLRFGPAVWQPEPAGSAVAGAWRDGLLEVHDRPLAEVVAALRPYHPGVLRLSPAAAAIRVSGVFSLDDPQRTLDALAHTIPVRVRRYTPWIVIVERA